MKRKISFVSAVVVIAVLAAGAAFAAADTIGVINVQKVIYEHPKYKEVLEQVQKTSKQKENEAREAVEKESDPAKKAQVMQTKRMELAREEDRLMGPIIQACEMAVRTVAKNKGVTVVLEKTSVYFGGVDITEDVIKQLKLGAK